MIFLEYGHVAHQIKAEEGCSNMVANSTIDHGMGSKGQTISFSESGHIAHQIKRN